MNWENICGITVKCKRQPTFIDRRKRQSIAFVFTDVWFNEFPLRAEVKEPQFYPQH